MTNNDTKPRVAFIGLGAMGYPMAARLAGAGFPLAVVVELLSPVVERRTHCAWLAGVSPINTERDPVPRFSRIITPARADELPLL